MPGSAQIPTESCILISIYYPHGSTTYGSSNPSLPSARRQQTRDHLLAAAAQVFAERGFHGASLDEVAAVAGFTKGAVYSNFKNKEDLFLALFKANCDGEMDALRATLAESEAPPGARISDFIDLVQQGMNQTNSNFGLLYQEFWLYAARNPVARDRLLSIENEAIGALATIIEAERRKQGLDPLESPEQMARIIDVLFRGISLLRVHQPEVVDDRLIDAAIAFVSRGLGAPNHPSDRLPLTQATGDRPGLTSAEEPSTVGTTLRRPGHSREGRETAPSRTRRSWPGSWPGTNPPRRRSRSRPNPRPRTNAGTPRAGRSRRDRGA